MLKTFKTMNIHLSNTHTENPPKSLKNDLIWQKEEWFNDKNIVILSEEIVFKASYVNWNNTHKHKYYGFMAVEYIENKEEEK